MRSVSSDGMLVRDARRRAGLSQRRLAELAGTSQAMVARVEGGRQSPSLATLRRLLAACGANLMVQVDGESLPAEAREDAPQSVEPSRFLLVRLGDARMAIPLAAVREVMSDVSPRRLPGQPPAMLGTVLVRGEALPCIDLAERLGMPPASAAVGAVLEARDGPLVALVSEAQDVRELARETIRPIPAGWTSCEPLRHLAQVDDELVPILDPGRLGVAGRGQLHSSATHSR